MIAEKHKPIDNQENDFFDSDELMDEPVYGPVVELVDEYVERDSEAVEDVKEDVQKNYETIKLLREDTERYLFDIRRQIYLVNDSCELLLEEDNVSRLRLLVADKRLSDTYAREIKRCEYYIRIEEFLKVVLSTSIFEDGKFVYEVDDHIKFVLKLERS